MALTDELRAQLNEDELSSYATGGDNSKRSWEEVARLRLERTQWQREAVVETNAERMTREELERYTMWCSAGAFGSGWAVDRTRRLIREIEACWQDMVAKDAEIRALDGVVREGEKEIARLIAQYESCCAQNDRIMADYTRAKNRAEAAEEEVARLRLERTQWQREAVVETNAERMTREELVEHTKWSGASPRCQKLAAEIEACWQDLKRLHSQYESCCAQNDRIMADYTRAKNRAEAAEEEVARLRRKETPPGGWQQRAEAAEAEVERLRHEVGDNRIYINNLEAACERSREQGTALRTRAETAEAVLEKAQAAWELPLDSVMTRYDTGTYRFYICGEGWQDKQGHGSTPAEALAAAGMTPHVGMPITRHEALQTARETLERAEAGRIETADREAGVMPQPAEPQTGEAHSGQTLAERVTALEEWRREEEGK